MIDTNLLWWNCLLKKKNIKKWTEICYKHFSISYSDFKYINYSTLTLVEFSHLFYPHIVQTVANALLNSSHIYKSVQFNHLIAKQWNFFNNLKYRPCYLRKTWLNSAVDTKILQMKSMNIYITAFQLGVHGEALGFNSILLDILQHINAWVGISFSDTVDQATIQMLRINALEIIDKIDSVIALKIAFKDKESLRLWRVMVCYCWWWYDIPSHYMKLMFESANKRQIFQITQGQNWKSDVMLRNATSRNRVLKDSQFWRCNMNVKNMNNPYGSAILNQTNNEILFDKNTRIILQKYQQLINNDGINFNSINKQIPVILNNTIKPNLWKRYYKKTEINYNNMMTQSQKITKKYIHDFNEYIPSMVQYLLNDDSTLDIPNCVVEFQKCLMNGTVQVTKIFSAGVIHHTYMDGQFKPTDLLWMVYQNDFILHEIKTMWQIEYLDSLTWQDSINTNKIGTLRKILLTFGCQWEPCNNGTKNLETYKYNNICVATPTKNKQVMCLQYTIQQLYVGHEHVKPKKGDYNYFRFLNKNFPSDDQLKLSNFRLNAKNNFDYSGERLPYCGIGVMCITHSIINCEDCPKNNKTKMGKTIYHCCWKAHPRFRIYSIYQGNITRWGSARSVNNLWLRD